MINKTWQRNDRFYYPTNDTKDVGRIVSIFTDKLYVYSYQEKMYHYLTTDKYIKKII